MNIKNYAHLVIRTSMYRDLVNKIDGFGENLLHSNVEDEIKNQWFKVCEAFTEIMEFVIKKDESNLNQS